jgi:S-adenosylmethionine decarboxylase
MSNVLGHHFLIEMYDCDAQLLNDVAGIQAQMLNVAVSCQMTIIQHFFHHFTPHGISGFIVIAESHLAIHTWPEYRYAAVDLFTCGRTDLLEGCLHKLRENFQCQRISAVKVMRGDKVAPERISPLFLETDLQYEQIEETDAPVAANAAYQPLHPDLFRYDGNFVERFIAPAMAFSHTQRWRKAIQEVAEQVYLFQLFQPEFCRLLIEECEHCNEWVTALEQVAEPHPLKSGIVDVVEPETTLSWDAMPGLSEVYAAIIKNHVQPIMESLWQTFKLQKWDVPAVRKFEPEGVKDMALHYDNEIIGMIGYLNQEFTGGGTYFPRWNRVIGRSGEVPVGSVIVYPGGLSHEHAVLPVTAGKRYMLANSFY